MIMTTEKTTSSSEVDPRTADRKPNVLTQLWRRFMSPWCEHDFVAVNESNTYHRVGNMYEVHVATKLVCEKCGQVSIDRSSYSVDESSPTDEACSR